MFKNLSRPFHKYHVGHFVKNIQKVFLVVFIGVPFLQNCGSFQEQFQATLGVIEESGNDIENTEDTEVPDTTEETEDARRSSITTFFSFTSNEDAEVREGREGHYNEAFSHRSGSLAGQQTNRSV